MNSFKEPFDEQAADSAEFSRSELDRMVDGELSEDEQRSLLQRLEESPSGWRELALAYVEAAVWKEQFSPKKSSTDSGCEATLSAVIAPIADSQVEAAPLSGKPENRQQSAMASAFAAVAVLLVFGLGIWLGRTQIELPAQPTQIADNPQSPSANVANTSPLEGPIDPTTTVERNTDAPIPKTVQVVYSDGQSDVWRFVDVPIADAEPGDGSKQLDEFWNRPESAISPELRADLEKSGHRITESRDLWPAQLPDGRSVVIPVSQIHVANNPLVFP
jgi:hypothetical protein